MPGKEGPRWVGCVRGRGGSLGGGGGKHSKTVVGGLREGGWLGGGRGIGTGSWGVLRGGVRGLGSGEGSDCAQGELYLWTRMQKRWELNVCLPPLDR